MSKTPLIVALATAWGPKHGGINAFNVDLLRSLGISPRRAFDLICVVLAADAADVDDARRHHVELLSLNRPDLADFPGDAAEAILAALGQRATSHCLWLGHDNKSGGLALRLRDAVPDSRAALIHHMAFGAYQDFKKGDSGAARSKREEQRELFRRADLCFGVGPMLVDHLKDMLRAQPKMPPVAMLVPGLAEPDPEAIHLDGQPPRNFTAFIAGRLGNEDDRIKQGSLAVRGFGEAVKRIFATCDTTHAIRKSPALRMRGVPESGHREVREMLEQSAGRTLTCDLADYTEDRIAYFRDLASSSVALMPSWHEGFGLVAWEAIACQVPVVIGEQSGVYRLLHDMHLGVGLGRSVYSVAVAGHAGDGEIPNHTAADVEQVADALVRIGNRLTDAKADAVALPGLLRRHDYTWRGCAETLVGALEAHCGRRLRRADVSPATAPAVSVPAGVLVPEHESVPEWLCPPSARRVSAAQNPSALLVARDRVARFDAEREAVVERLLAWTDVDPGVVPVSLHLLVGPGGMGKTRTAFELLERATRQGQRALWLASSLPDDYLEDWTRWLETTSGQAALLVIDYAEGRQEPLLRLLAAALARAGRGDFGGLRILALARNGEWWRDLAKHPQCDADSAYLLTDPGTARAENLPPWSLDGRAATYRAAIADYAAAMGREAPTNSYVPPLDAPVFARPLYLHLAALAALDGERPLHARSLLESQVLREWRYWRAAQGAQVDYDDWADALAWVSLVQGADGDAAAAAFDTLGLDGQALAVRFVAAYPDGRGGIIPLQPDLLAETLLRERLAGKRGAAILATAMPPDNAAMFAASLETIRRLTEHAVWGDDESVLLPWQRSVGGALAAAWLSHGQALIDAAHVAADGFARLLLLAWQFLDAPTRARIAPELSLPDYSTPLLTLSVFIERAVLASATEECQRAGVLNNLATRLSEQGGAASRAEALECARESVAIYRRLAETQPAAYLPDLAMSFNTLANRLSEQGDVASRVEALECARESVAIYRRLAETQPAAYLPKLAASLNNLASHLSEQGDAASRAEALDSARESVAIRRRLAETQPAAHLPDLAMSLNTLASHLSEQVDAASRAEALDSARESVAICRQLAETQPAAYLPDLAMSLNNLATALSAQVDAASRAEALKCARESVAIYRRLSETQPAAHLPDLAASLNNLANRLSEQGDAASRAEALDSARESVAICRRLAETQPAAYLPNLATSLNTLVILLSEQGGAASRAEALECARESVAIYAVFHAESPAAFERNLRIAIANWHQIALALDRNIDDEGRRVDEEAGKILALFAKAEGEGAGFSA